MISNEIHSIHRIKIEAVPGKPGDIILIKCSDGSIAVTIDPCVLTDGAATGKKYLVLDADKAKELAEVFAPTPNKKGA